MRRGIAETEGKAARVAAERARAAREFPPSYFFLLTSYFSHRAWKQKSRRGIPAPGGFLIDSLTLCQVEGIERRLVDYRRRGKPLIGLISGERFPSQRSEQSIHFTCVIAHLL